MFGVKATAKVAAVGFIATGTYWMLRRSIAVGVEGHRPSFYLRGLNAFFAGAVMASFGVLVLAYPETAVCMFGWGAEGECQAP